MEEGEEKEEGEEEKGEEEGRRRRRRGGGGGEEEEGRRRRGGGGGEEEEGRRRRGGGGGEEEEGRRRGGGGGEEESYPYPIQDIPRQHLTSLSGSILGMKKRDGRGMWEEGGWTSRTPHPHPLTCVPSRTSPNPPLVTSPL